MTPILRALSLALKDLSDLDQARVLVFAFSLTDGAEARENEPVGQRALAFLQSKQLTGNGTATTKELALHLYGSSDQRSVSRAYSLLYGMKKLGSIASVRDGDVTGWTTKPSDAG